MLSKHNNKKNGGRQDPKYLSNLKEDLRVLETSWRNKNLQPKRVVRHFVEIIDSLSEVARIEDIDSAGVICANLKEYLSAVGTAKAELGERAWTTASDLIDLLRDSLSNGDVPHAGFENLRSRWKEEAESLQVQRPNIPVGPEGPATVSVEAESPKLEVNEMPDVNEIDPKELLQKAQEALLSGQGESAKEMALRAAELIARGEAEQRKQKELGLRANLENITNEESEIEQSIGSTNEMIAEREEELNNLTERFSQAQSALDERETACKKIREEIEKTETEMASIKAKHKELLDRFQEVLPAKDAAERECARIKAQYGELPSELESLRDNLQDMEHQLDQVRTRKAEAEAELEKFAEKSTV